MARQHTTKRGKEGERGSMPSPLTTSSLAGSRQPRREASRCPGGHWQVDGGPGPSVFSHPRRVSVPLPHPREDSMSWDLIPPRAPLPRAGGLLAEGECPEEAPQRGRPPGACPTPTPGCPARLGEGGKEGGRGPARPCPWVSQGRGRVSVGRASHENLMPPCRLLIFVCFSLFARREASFISPDCHYPALNFHRAGREAGPREAGRGVGWGLPGLGLWGAETSSPGCLSAHC